MKKVHSRKHTTAMPDDGIIIQARKLVKKFGSRTVLRQIDLQVKKGDLWALFGPNGAGKTTLIQILSSLMLPTSGEARISGFDPRYDREAIHRRIGLISHDPFLYDHLSAFENLKFYAMMYDIPKPEEKIKGLLKRVGLIEFQSYLVQTFSRGMKQRLSIARAIIHDPCLLFLDEPYNGLDQKGIEDLKQLLEGFKKERKTIIMTSHHLERALELCTHAAILKSGRLVHEQNMQEIFAGDFKQAYFRHTQQEPSPLRVAV
ncbi:MAG: ABC transporter ATP-binding protein [Deltaproteobacteria bacterium]|nr:ABC transporter ATP-binding protein [Deltaproteobacteria bacterium]